MSWFLWLHALWNFNTIGVSDSVSQYRKSPLSTSDIFPHLQNIKTRAPIGTMLPISHNWSAINNKSGNERAYWTLKSLKTISVNNYLWFIPTFFNITSQKITILPNTVCTHRKCRVLELIIWWKHCRERSHWLSITTEHKETQLEISRKYLFTLLIYTVIVIESVIIGRPEAQTDEGTSGKLQLVSVIRGKIQIYLTHSKSICYHYIILLQLLYIHYIIYNNYYIYYIIIYTILYIILLNLSLSIHIMGQ